VVDVSALHGVDNYTYSPIREIWRKNVCLECG
jgi:hypothetical protein